MKAAGKAIERQPLTTFHQQTDAQPPLRSSPLFKLLCKHDIIQYFVTLISLAQLTRLRHLPGSAHAWLTHWVAGWQKAFLMLCMWYSVRAKHWWVICAVPITNLEQATTQMMKRSNSIPWQTQHLCSAMDVHVSKKALMKSGSKSRNSTNNPNLVWSSPNPYH